MNPLISRPVAEGSPTTGSAVLPDSTYDILVDTTEPPVGDRAVHRRVRQHSTSVPLAETTVPLAVCRR